jgi:hypothetical protein
MDATEVACSNLCLRVGFLMKWYLLNPLMGSVRFLMGSDSGKGAV